MKRTPVKRILTFICILFLFQPSTARDRLFDVLEKSIEEIFGKLTKLNNSINTNIQDEKKASSECTNVSNQFNSLQQELDSINQIVLMNKNVQQEFAEKILNTYKISKDISKKIGDLTNSISKMRDDLSKMTDSLNIQFKQLQQNDSADHKEIKDRIDSLAMQIKGVKEEMEELRKQEHNNRERNRLIMESLLAQEQYWKNAIEIDKKHESRKRGRRIVFGTFTVASAAGGIFMEFSAKESSAKSIQIANEYKSSGSNANYEQYNREYKAEIAKTKQSVITRNILYTVGILSGFVVIIPF